jgi:hypothetical protein
MDHGEVWIGENTEGEGRGRGRGGGGRREEGRVEGGMSREL